ncbi:MAG: IS5 family transposase [Duganella sp.]
MSPHLPPHPHRGHAYVDHRRVINGILWRLRTDAPWRDVPARYGPWQTCYDRFVRWSRNGMWQRLLKILQAQAEQAGMIDWDGAALDATHVKAHRSSAGARKKFTRSRKKGALTDEWLGRSRGGITSKIHLCVDGHGLPLSIVITAGQCSDAAQIGAVLDAIHVPRAGPGRPRQQPTAVRVDRAYGARCYQQQFQQRGIRCICPERLDAKKNRLHKGSKGGSPPRFDPKAYRGRNVVERAINSLKDFRAVAMRHEKRGHNFFGSVILATIMLWLRRIQSDTP